MQDHTLTFGVGQYEAHEREDWGWGLRGGGRKGWVAATPTARTGGRGEADRKREIEK